MKRVIITGGTGMIGTALTKSLVESDYEVIVLSRSPQAKAGLVPGGARIEGWDGKSAEGWGRLADGAFAIVNLAGESLADGRWTDERKRRIITSRTNPGSAVVEAVRAAQDKPNVVIQASGSNSYGPRGDEVITESSSLGNDFLADVCKQWEASTAEVEQMGVRRAIIRMGIVLSTSGGALPRIMLPFRLFAGGPIGSGQQYWTWIHLDDAVAVIKYLIEHEDTAGPFNSCAPNPVKQKEFARTLGQVMNRPSYLPAPAFAFKIGFGEMSTVLLDGQRMVPERLLEHGYSFQFPTLESALKDLLK